MKTILRTLGLVALVVGLVAPLQAGEGNYYEITVVNLTKGQTFTPILAASHRAGVSIFELGQPATAELQAIAEFGDTAPMTALLLADPLVVDVVTGPDVIPPGGTQTFTLGKGRGNNRISLAGMLIPTNDGFVALNGVRTSGGSVTYFAFAYDSGTELNTESCSDIPGPGLPFPGPECSGGATVGQGEGYVYVHNGIQGIDGLKPWERDWHNPVAKIVITAHNVDEQ